MLTLKSRFAADIYGGVGADNGEQPVNFASEPRPIMVYYRGSINLAVDHGPAIFPAQMKPYGIPNTPYHVILPNNITAQFETFVRAATIAGAWDGTTWNNVLPPILDLEYEPAKAPKRKPANWDYWNPSGANWANQVKKFLDLCESTFHVRPWIYTSRNYANVLNTGFGLIAPSWFKDYQFIVAWYPFSPDDFDLSTLPVSVIPRGVSMSQVIGWQYEANGRSNGLAYNDLNQMSDAVVSLLNGSSDPAPAPAPIPEPAPAPLPIPAPSDGWQYARVRVEHPSRTSLPGWAYLPSTPATIRFIIDKFARDFTKLTSTWQAYERSFNSAKSNNYFEKKNAGLFNYGFPKLLKLTTETNVLKVRGGPAVYEVQSLDFAGAPPTGKQEDSILQQFTVIDAKSNIFNGTAGGDGIPVFWPLVSDSKLSIAAEKIELFPALPISVTLAPWVTAGLRVRETPSISGNVLGALQEVGPYPIDAYACFDGYVWGRVPGRGWIALAWNIGGQKYSTSWKMETQQPPRNA